MMIDVLRVALQSTLSDAKLAEYAPHIVAAMKAAEITTVYRAAAWFSQIGHESGGLKYMAEIQTSSPSWNADRTRYRGRGPIQLTWRANYLAFGQWCVRNGFSVDPDMFVNRPELVEQPKWGFLAASYYWMNGGPRPGQINSFADAGDIYSVSKCVNGWRDPPNGWADRKARWGKCVTLGNKLLGGAMATWYDKDRSSEFSFGGPRSVKNLIGVCIHTAEAGPGASADDVTTYQASSKTGSYNVVVGQDGTRVLQNTDDWITWSTGNKGNSVLLNLCFVGTASWSRAQWLFQDRMLRAGATVVRHWCDLYGFPLKKVTAAQLPGILGHVDTRVWGGTDHTDPGPNFPYDVLIKYAKEGSGKASVENLINKEAAVAVKWIGKRVESREIPTPDKRGVFSVWEKAHIYYRWGAPAAYAVPHGGIFEAWSARGWEAGECGFPIARHEVLSWGGRQDFEGGTLYVPFDATKGFLVHGAIKAAYDESGGVTGPYGLPSSDEYKADEFGRGCIAQDFVNTTLVFSPRGVVSVKH